MARPDNDLFYKYGDGDQRTANEDLRLERQDERKRQEREDDHTRVMQQIDQTNKQIEQRYKQSTKQSGSGGGGCLLLLAFGSSALLGLGHIVGNIFL